MDKPWLVVSICFLAVAPIELIPLFSVPDAASKGLVALYVWGSGDGARARVWVHAWRAKKLVAL